MIDVDPSVTLGFHRFGPYHRARLNAVRSRLAGLASLEFSSVDEYAWEAVPVEQPAHISLFCDADVNRKPAREVARRVGDALDRLAPAVLAVPGWSHPAALRGLAWCLRNSRSAVLMSESTAHDERRVFWREWIKRRVVRLFAAALVGGAPQAAYARELGIPEEAIFPGYDAVDNAYFAEQAARVRDTAEVERTRLDLPVRFFLAASRFIAKKNLPRLLEAYAAYRARAGADAWHLVLLGDGELRADIESRIARPDLAGRVMLAGFRQYDELPAYYGLASAFVHASTTEQWGLVVNEAMACGLPVLVSERCGCAPDLVEDGVNGFTFDPYDIQALARLMQWVTAMPDERRAAMGRAGQRIIADWGPERFADGLMLAVQAALRQPPRIPSLFDHALLWALARRPL
jgi:1,2-diacylglycerol 3-alpha-glucosyltransferase